MRKTLTSLVMLLIIPLFSCSESDNPVADGGLSVAEMEARVAVNCEILKDAVEEFRANNGGLAPGDIHTDTDNSGRTVIDLLPGGQLLENPFTGLRTEPVAAIAAGPGQIGYYRHRDFETLYFINGYGEHYTIVELSDRYELEQKVIANCALIREAAERFAGLNGGVYPSNTSSTTPQGVTLIDLLPESRLLTNPFTLLGTEPVDCVAVNSGEAGYLPVSDGGLNVGYSITGNGLDAGERIFMWWQTPDDSMIVVYGVEVFSTE